MALDDITIGGNKVATDKDGDDRHYQFMKVSFGAEDAFVLVADADGFRLPVKAVVSGAVSLGAGAAAIGSVGVTSLPSIPAGGNNIGDVDIVDYPASDFATDGMVVRRDMSKLSFGVGAPVDVLRLPVGVTAQNGTAEIAPAVTSKRLVLLSMMLVTSAAGKITIKDNASTPNVLIGPVPLGVTTGFSLPFNEHGWGITAAGKNIQLQTSVSMDVGGVFQYAVID